MFDRFKALHPTTKPAIIWKVPSNRNELNLCRMIADIWIESPYSPATVCALCEQIYIDKYKHIVADCPSTQFYRNAFLDENQTFITNTMSSEMFLLDVLGRHDTRFSSTINAFNFVRNSLNYYYSEITSRY